MRRGKGQTYRNLKNDLVYYIERNFLLEPRSFFEIEKKNINDLIFIHLYISSLFDFLFPLTCFSCFYLFGCDSYND